MTKGRDWDKVRRQRAGSEQPVPQQGVVMHSKFRSTCLICGGVIEKGEAIMWRRGEGSWHVDDCSS